MKINVKFNKIGIFIVIIFTYLMLISTTEPVKIKGETNVSNIVKKENVVNTKEVIEKLCSDKYCERLVGCKGNEKSAEYLADILKRIGLEPVFGDTYCVPYTQWVYPKYNVIDEANCQYKPVNNVAGVIKGADSSKAVIISAHFDNIEASNKDRHVLRGALDNASGVAAVSKIAESLKNKSGEKQFERDIIFVFFNGEETDFQGSSAFVKKIKPKYVNLYNINIDCIGGKDTGKITLHNPSENSKKLTESMKRIFNYNKLPYSEIPLKGGSSDNRSFEKAGLSNICICQDSVYRFIHKDKDNPEIIDFNEIDKLSEVICDFIINNDKVDF